MSKKRILIAYGTRFGSTEEVSKELASLFEKEGQAASVVDLRATPRDQWPSPEDFDGILVGSSIKKAEWTSEPKQFLEKNKERLGGDIPLGVFVCSAFASDPEKRPQLKEEYIGALLKQVGVRAAMYDAFGGIIDFSKASRMSWMDKKILKLASKKNPAVKKDVRNDLRDWDQIKAFGESFLRLVNNPG